MVEAMIHQDQEGEDRFPAGPRALLSWLQSGRKGSGTCVTVLSNLTSSCQQPISRSFRSTIFREVTFIIFDQRDGEKDDVTMVKKTKYVV